METVGQCQPRACCGRCLFSSRAEHLARGIILLSVKPSKDSYQQGLTRSRVEETCIEVLPLKVRRTLSQASGTFKNFLQRKETGVQVLR